MIPIQEFLDCLSKNTGIPVTPHMFRHTHATELIRSKMKMSYVQKRLRQASIQTAINTYIHLNTLQLT
ncbi:tyrosine-type recombinase/integrase [Anabaena azotica]|uniref:tyrosine-type recombinase/integrase n=1 Tax=Anabaena azotica TaxID=197653 RepID=UPI0024114764|nr:tyrosine-type recombinase/integrase [Anabaena azotica]